MVPMINRKIICIVLILLFGLSLSVSGAWGEITCDKEQCKHDAMKGTQYYKAEMNFKPMGCCAETQNDPCELEGNRPHVIQDCAVSMTRVHKDGLSDAVATGSGFIPDKLAQRLFGRHPNTGMTHVLSLPIYIKNGSLIC
jgi:hypothetical protein